MTCTAPPTNIESLLSAAQRSPRPATQRLARTIQSHIDALRDRLVAEQSNAKERAKVERQIAALAAKMEAAHEALAHLGPNPARPKRRYNITYGHHDCGYCDFWSTTRAGIAAHRRLKHGTHLAPDAVRGVA